MLKFSITHLASEQENFHSNFIVCNFRFKRFDKNLGSIVVKPIITDTFSAKSKEGDRDFHGDD